jgi:hypothetical protein
MTTKDTSTVWQGYPDAIKAAAVGQPRASWSDCFQELKPELDDIVQLIKTAPLLLREKEELAFYIAAHFFGVVAGITRKNPQQNAREIADLIVEHVREKPDLQLIELCGDQIE